MTVPNTFANATTAIPLVQLDQNFNTGVTLGNTTVYLGNTTTTLGNVALTGATVNFGQTTLNYYGEGTWTPVPANLTVVGTPTYTGRYTRIGRQCTLTLNVSSTTSTTSQVNNTTWSGLPFTPLAISAGFMTNNAGNNLSVPIYASTGNFIATGIWTAEVQVFGSVIYFI